MGSGSLELWGGLECTIARIGDRFRDQVAETGHRDRPEDLDLVAGLGIRTLRYPILWESVQPEGTGASDFGWHDGRLARLRDRGIRPIAGLLHHGSGPRSTDLLDPGFPARFARHAGRVAHRYPWIDLYTPINEPLTTARFSALYGHWYPHRRSYGAFLAALVGQCRATLLAMRAIRRVNPDARFVQTEDMGRVFSTPALAPQAEHENERRWLTFDLLFGRVDRDHRWWRIFRDHGITARDLDAFRDGESAPDIVGINHYLTSERYLDERTEHYPPWLAGGNGRERYADVEAVRMDLPRAALGPAARLRETWERYGAPVAVTEVHHGCTRDEQLRWFVEVWRAAEQVRREGADVRAVTAWALFGAADWNSLLTRREGIYEPGAYDVRGPVPRPTALAGAARDLATKGRTDHPVLDAEGWWHRPGRFYAGAGAGHPAIPRSRRAILICGPDGPLRATLLRIAETRALACRVVGAGEASSRLADAAAEEIWASVTLGTLAGPGQEGRAGRRRRSIARLAILPSSVRPARRAGEAAPGGLVVRTGPLFGCSTPDDLVASILADLAGGRPIAPGEGTVSPTYLPDLAHVVLDLLIDGATGTVDLTSGTLERDALVGLLERRTGLRRASSRRPIPPPGPVGPGSPLMPPLESALDRYLADCGAGWRAAAAEPSPRAA